MALLVALFIVVPIVELYVIIQVGQWIGVVPTLALLVAGALVGSILVRREGRSVWRRFTTTLSESRFPGREVADGAMIAVGGTLLLTPGFITDAFGLLLLIPPSRAVIRGALRGFFRRRFVILGPSGPGGAGGGFGGPAQTPGTGERPPTGGDYDFEGTAEEVDQEDPRLPPT